MLEIVEDKKVPEGAVVVATGTAGKLRSDATAYGSYVDDGKLKGWFVPGTQDEQEEHKRMDLVIAFSKKLARAHAKRKGRAAVLAFDKEHGV